MIPYVDDVFIVGMVGGIAQGLELLIESNPSNIFHVPCFNEDIRQHIVATMDILLPYGMIHFILSSKANGDTWEEHLRGRLIGKHLAQWRSLSDVDATGEGEEILQHSSL